MKKYYFECKKCHTTFKAFSDGTDIYNAYCKDCIKTP